MVDWSGAKKKKRGVPIDDPRDVDSDMMQVEE
jgi:hypothetical protein